MKNCSIFFLLIILLAATLVQCHYEHWYQHFNKDSTTSTTTAKILAADAKAEASGGNVKNSNSFPDDDFPDDFEERMGRRATLAVGVVIAIVVACIMVCCGICYCFIRLCNVMCNHDQPGHVIFMNSPTTQAEQPVPQVIVQQVPYQPGTYPSQQSLNYAGQMNAQMQHVPPEAPTQSQEAKKFQTNYEIYQQSNYSPHDPNLQPLIPPPPYQKF